MARNDIKVVNNITPEATYTPIVSSGGVSTILTGTPTKMGTVTTGNVLPMVDGDGTTTQRFAGLAKSDSSDTASAAGTVTLWIPLPGLVYSGVAKSASAANTAALLAALFGKRVVFDLTSTVWTIDTAASDAASNALCIIGGDYQTNTVYFSVSSGCTILSNITN